MKGDSGAEKIALDELDREILSLIARDSRISGAEIARRIDAPARTVLHRINNLVERGVVSFITNINHRLFGYTVLADIFCEVESKQAESIAAQIAELPEVRYVGISFGEKDITVQAVTKNTEALYELVSQRVEGIPGVLRTSTVIVPKVVKDIHAWIPAEIADA
jgi:Lrp/AsnC family transcriptional regulator for asnA, asnC and gidA